MVKTHEDHLSFDNSIPSDSFNTVSINKYNSSFYSFDVSKYEEHLQKLHTIIRIKALIAVITLIGGAILALGINVLMIGKRENTQERKFLKTNEHSSEDILQYLVFFKEYMCLDSNIGTLANNKVNDSLMLRPCLNDTNDFWTCVPVKKQEIPFFHLNHVRKEAIGGIFLLKIMSSSIENMEIEPKGSDRYEE
ncbi:hypothetical protein ABEB36_006891 [Hypothenemus hampei]|uniref:Uncharacterized protein n=1 Tax=Hypothenemus hampei TaxID=57062 RepID=A0ABD1ES50_HYPHA